MSEIGPKLSPRLEQQREARRQSRAPHPDVGTVVNAEEIYAKTEAFIKAAMTLAKLHGTAFAGELEEQKKTIEGQLLDLALRRADAHAHILYAKLLLISHDPRATREGIKTILDETQPSLAKTVALISEVRTLLEEILPLTA